MSGCAIFSDCWKYRYTLVRNWDSSLQRLAIIGLNPSTADAVKDDPTIRRCKHFAQAHGYGSFVMLNLFALRSTDPSRPLKNSK